MKVRTWQIEAIVVLLLLVASLFFKAITFADVVCCIAVWITFLHAQVADRMQEKQAKMVTPDVECYKWSNRYFLVKEALWILFFVTIHSYPALIGSITFFIYPYYRKIYRKKKPLDGSN